MYQSHSKRIVGWFFSTSQGHLSARLSMLTSQTLNAWKFWRCLGRSFVAQSYRKLPSPIDLAGNLSRGQKMARIQDLWRFVDSSFIPIGILGGSRILIMFGGKSHEHVDTMPLSGCTSAKGNPWNPKRVRWFSRHHYMRHQKWLRYTWSYKLYVINCHNIKRSWLIIYFILVVYTQYITVYDSIWQCIYIYSACIYRHWN